GRRRDHYHPRTQMNKKTSLLAVAFVMTFGAFCRADATPRVLDLSQFPPDTVWRAANSDVTSRKDPDGSVVWRWNINRGGEGFLWLNESLTVHDELPKYQRLVYDVKFAVGEINKFWPRTVGLLPPPFDKMFCEWNLFYFTHP